MNTTLKLAITLFSLLFVTYDGTLLANSSGLSGRTTLSSQGCFSCHGQRSPATSVFLREGSGPIQMASGEARTFTLAVENSSMARAGVNIAVLRNENSGASVGLLRPSDNSLRQAGSELVQRTPLTMTNGSADFRFEWTAPQEPGTYFIHAVGNAVNGNGNADNGDRWNFMDVVAVNVAPAAQPELTLSSSQIDLRGTPFFPEQSENNTVSFTLDDFLLNSGQVDVVIESVEFSSAGGEASLRSPALPLTLSPNSTISLELDFTPDDFGEASISLNIASNAGTFEATVLLDIQRTSSVGENVSLRYGVKLAPMPAADVLYFQADNLPQGEYSVVLFDVTGTQHTSFALRSNGYSLREALPIPAHLPDGIYFLRFSSPERTFSVSFVRKR